MPPDSSSSSDSATQPLVINVDMIINEILEVNDHTHTISISLYMEFSWKDCRLLVNKSADAWRERDYQDVSLVHVNVRLGQDVGVRVRLGSSHK